MGQDKIMLIEDNRDLINLLKLALQKKNYEVLTAENGKDALELIEKVGMPDLILLDMKMPIMDGWEFAKKFGDQYGRQAPIVVMTAAEDSKTRAMEIGADSYIGKPFELENLFELIKSILS